MAALVIEDLVYLVSAKFAKIILLNLSQDWLVLAMARNHYRF